MSISLLKKRWRGPGFAQTLRNASLSIGSLLFCVVFFAAAGRPLVAEEPELAPHNPAFTDYAAKVQQGVPAKTTTAAGHRLGFVPPPVDLSHLKAQSTLRLQKGSLLPSAYDLRSVSPIKLTAVRDQGDYGTCWAFATYGSLESCLLPDESWDFSENNLVNLAGFDLGFDEGGNEFMSTAYLNRWSGPVLESVDPYPYPDSSPSGLTVQKHVQEVLFLPGRASSDDNNGIKEAIMDYGAVYTSMYFDDAAYNDTNCAYDYTGTDTDNNHSVCIVGWNDNFDRTKFNQPYPSAKGAFIVRNNWGNSWGDGGYFYVSYYDSNIGADNAIFSNGEDTDNYGYVYQYDPLGWVGNAGYGSDTAWFANIFIATNEKLGAVGFYTAAEDSAYSISVYTDVTAGNPVNGSLKLNSQTGTVLEAGYHTIILNTPVSLTFGQKFSVVVELTTPDYTYPIPLEYPYSGYSSLATADSGESFISGNGSSWTDITTEHANTNVCLKAFSSYPSSGVHDILVYAGSNGSISPSGTSYPYGTVVVDNGETATFTMTPDSGYHLSTLLVDDSPVDTESGALTSYAFETINSNHTIKAYFGVDQSSEDSGSGVGSCFIATAAFGSYQEPHVMILRIFRDRFLLTNRTGKAFVRFYYCHSPPMAEWIAAKSWVRPIVRTALLPLYGIAAVMLSKTLSYLSLFIFLGITIFLVFMATTRTKRLPGRTKRSGGPQQMQPRMLDGIKEMLKASDNEWQVMKPLVKKVPIIATKGESADKRRMT